MTFEYATRGVCSKKIDFEIDDEKKVHNIVFTGGCNGNLKAIGKLCEGQSAQWVIDTLKGNLCGFKDTSCGDQLAIGLQAALDKMNK